MLKIQNYLNYDNSQNVKNNKMRLKSCRISMDTFSMIKTSELVLEI